MEDFGASFISETIVETEEGEIHRTVQARQRTALRPTRKTHM